eukprot:scaffold139669_cov15-Tisochrysis_lutea.AAC.1
MQYILCASSPSGHIIPASLDIAAVKSKDTLADLLVRKPFLASYLTFFRGEPCGRCRSSCILMFRIRPWPHLHFKPF